MSMRRREQRTLRLPPEVDRAIRRVAESAGESQSTIVRTLLRDALITRGVLPADILPPASKVQA